MLLGVMFAHFHPLSCLVSSYLVLSWIVSRSVSHHMFISLSILLASQFEFVI